MFKDGAPSPQPPIEPDSETNNLDSESLEVEPRRKIERVKTIILKNLDDLESGIENNQDKDDDGIITLGIIESDEESLGQYELSESEIAKLIDLLKEDENYKKLYDKFLIELIEISYDTTSETHALNLYFKYRKEDEEPLGASSQELKGEEEQPEKGEMEQNQELEKIGNLVANNFKEISSSMLFDETEEERKSLRFNIKKPSQIEFQRDLTEEDIKTLNTLLETNFFTRFRGWAKNLQILEGKYIQNANKFIFVLQYEKDDDQTIEKKRVTLSGKCSNENCKHEVIAEREIPISWADKIKKDKKTGKRYRDWEFDAKCVCVSDYRDKNGNLTLDVNGNPKHRIISVFYREWLD